MAVLDTNMHRGTRAQRICTAPCAGWQIVRVLEGRAAGYCGGAECRLQPGTLLCIPPGLDCCLVPEGAYMDIQLVLSEPVVPGERGALVMQDDAGGTAATLMGLLGRLWREGSAANGENLLASLQKALQDFLIGLAGRKPDRTLVALSEQLRAKIPNAGFRVADAVRALPQSSSYTRRQFREAYGCSPTAYLNRQRVGVAQLYLLTQQLTIAEVAYACGFRDAKYFTRQFRQQTGMTPTQFLKTHRGP